MAEQVIEYDVPEGVEGARADKVFAAAFEGVSRVRLQKAFDAGAVTFEGEVVSKRFKINRPGRLRALLQEPSTEKKPQAIELPLDILFEDAVMVVVNKAPGMVTHPGNGTGENTLVHALLHHCDGKLSSVGAPERPGIVHRLDKETSGLIVVAKTDQAHHRLATAFSERETYKRYKALVIGRPCSAKGSIREPIGRHPVMRTRMSVQPQGRAAHTDYELLETYRAGASLLNCVIHTGRTHQIRVHLSHLGHPLLGDTTYGFKAGRLSGVDVPRVMLHATELRLAHPASGESMCFNAALPGDFNRLMAALA